MQRTNSNRLSQLLVEFVREQGLEEGLRNVRIGNAWDKAVGEKYALHTTSKYFKNGTLYCTVDSSIVRNQLYFRQDDIVAQINSILGESLVTKLVLR